MDALTVSTWILPDGKAHTMESTMHEHGSVIYTNAKLNKMIEASWQARGKEFGSAHAEAFQLGWIRVLVKHDFFAVQGSLDTLRITAVRKTLFRLLKLHEHTVGKLYFTHLRNPEAWTLDPEMNAHKDGGAKMEYSYYWPSQRADFMRMLNDDDTVG